MVDAGNVEYCYVIKTSNSSKKWQLNFQNQKIMQNTIFKEKFETDEHLLSWNHSQSLH